MQRILITAISLLILSSPITAGEATYAQQQEELTTIAQRIVAELAQDNLPDGSQERNDYLSKLTEQADQLLAIENGYWSRYPNADSPSISHNGAAFNEIFVLAQAYTTRDGKHYRSPVVMEAITRGLRHFLTFVHKDCPKPHNWWAWDIGIPMHLIRTLLLIEGRLEPDLVKAEKETLTYLLKATDDVKLRGPAQPLAKPHHGKTDMNSLWHARLRLQFAVLMRNTAMAGKWSQQAFSEITTPGQGSWQADFSYKFHGQVPMWTYGNAFIHDYGMIMRRYQGTTFGPTDEQIKLFGQMVEHYYEGFLYKGRICPAIIGRTLSRRDDPQFDVHGPLALTSLATLAESNHPDADRYAAIVMRDAPLYRNLKHHQEKVDDAKRRIPEVTPAPPVDDIFVYPDSDFLQVTRPDWAVGIKLHSVRNGGYESINRENLQGWFLSYGSTFHYRNGNEWNSCWPTIDWTRLAGTTVARDIKQGSTSPFAGVMRSSKNNGLAAVELKCESFTARKSWLVQEDHIVCMGSAIAGPGRVETTVFNQPIEPGSAIVIDGQHTGKQGFNETTRVAWCWVDGMGYVFTEPQELLVIRETRTSDHSSIRGAHLHGKGETRTHEYATGVITHDKERTSYTYVMIPNVTLESMPTWINSIRSNYTVDLTSAHHVSTKTAAVESVVFWRDGKSGSIASDQACMMLREGGDWQVVNATWTDAPVHVVIDNHKYKAQPSNGRPYQLK